MKWEVLEKRLKQAAHLDEESDLAAVVKRRGNVKLGSKPSVAGSAKLLKDYIGARADGLEQGLLDDADPKVVMRVMEDFKGEDRW